MKSKIFDWWNHFDLLCFISFISFLIFMLCSCLTVFLLQDRKCVKRWTLDFHGDQTLTVSDHKAIKHWPTLTTCYLPRLCSCLFLSLKPADTENICQKIKNLPQRTSWSIYLFWIKHLKHFKTFFNDRHEFYILWNQHTSTDLNW